MDSGRVTALIDRLSNRDFVDREAAQKELIALLPEFNAANFAQLRTATGDRNEPLEAQRRIQGVLQRFVPALPPVAKLLDSVRVKGPLATDPILLWTNFDFGGFKGRVLPLFGLNPLGMRVFAGLEERYEAIRNSVAGGNFNKMATEQLFDELRSYVFSLSDDEFASLNLTIAGKAVTRGQVIGAIDQAIAQIAPAIDDLGKQSVGANPSPPSNTTVTSAGFTPLGLSLGIDIQTLVRQGELASFDTDYSLTLGEIPTSFQLVGHVYDLLATDGLVVTDHLGVSIEYGEVQLIGNAVVDPSLLRIARLANGQFELAADFTNDLGRHIITGFYDAPSAGSGLDQFGEFVVVQVVEEPSALALLVVALCTMFLWSHIQSLREIRSGDLAR